VGDRRGALHVFFFPLIFNCMRIRGDSRATLLLLLLLLLAAAQV